MVEPSLTKAVLYGVASAVSVSLGKGLQKVGVAVLTHPRTMLRGDNLPRFLVWCLGTGGIVASPFLLFAACAYGPMTLIGALGGTGLVALALFCAFVLGEPIGAGELAGIALIVGGTAVVGLFDGRPGLPALGGGGATGTIHVANLAAFSVAIAALSVAAGAWAYRAGASRFGVLFGGVSGLCGGISVFYQKAAMTTCGCTDIFADIPAALRNPYFYLFIVGGLLDFATTQVALARAKAVTVVPAYQSFYIVVPIVGGLAAYGEGINVVQAAGIALLLWGVVLLSLYVARERAAASEPASGREAS